MTHLVPRTALVRPDELQDQGNRIVTCAESGPMFMGRRHRPPLDVKPLYLGTVAFFQTGQAHLTGRQAPTDRYARRRRRCREQFAKEREGDLSLHAADPDLVLDIWADA